MCECIILEDYIVEKYIYNEQNGLWYELQGDFYIPCLELPVEKEERHIGIWGHRHLRYIREYKKVLYTDLLINGKQQSYLADVEEQAQELFDRLMKQRAEHEGITETLKAENQMEWVGRMGALWSAVTETLNTEVIFV
ncbi:TnpV protein [Holdemanella biformis]|uniref:TnpV protein n=1 Tax=Holdemanella porci TaxID=2652276 RepID=A0A6N7VGX2_9FIRM|nr:TnpV protein [Holdemanella porci]